MQMKLTAIWHRTRKERQAEIMRLAFAPIENFANAEAPVSLFLCDIAPGKLD